MPPDDTPRPENYFVALVTARSGSKRVPEKNVRPIGGETLLEIAIKAAMSARGVHETAISTDSEAYLALARAAGIDEAYIRPAELSEDHVSSIATVLHYLDWRDDHNKPHASHIVLLQPTSPFRRANHIDEALEKMTANNRQSLVSLTPATPGSRYIVHRRQEPPSGDLKIEEGGDDIYVLDGSLFITPVDMLKSERRFWNEKSAAYINHYPRFFDIDSESDFMAADALLKHEWCLEGGTPGDHNLN
jgi:CMP-N,N'-diacetyllegionaminic acid synthase